MLKKTITFTDYDGVERTEDFYFNLNKSEIIKWMMTSGDYTIDKVMIQLFNEKNGKKIMEFFEQLIKISYGRKSLDGRRFEKSDEIWNDFFQTEAYDALFEELVLDADKAADFFNAVIPKKMAEDAKKTIEENPDAIPESMRSFYNGATIVKK